MSGPTLADGLAALDLGDVTTALAALRRGRESAARRELAERLGGRRAGARPVYPRRVEGLTSPSSRWVLSCRSAPDELLAIRARAARKLEARRLEPIRGPLSAAYAAAGYRSTTHGASTVYHVRQSAGACADTVKISNSDAGLPKSYNRGWGATASMHTITVRPSWVVDVYRRGIACVDGLLTLDAREHADGVLSALWVEQGRGTGLTERRGYLVRAEGGPWVHAETERGIARARRQSAERASSYQAAQSADADYLSAAAALTISIEHARAAGLCDAGIRDWCARRGLDPLGTVNGRQLLDIARTSGDRVALVERVIRRLLQQRAA